MVSVVKLVPVAVDLLSRVKFDNKSIIPEIPKYGELYRQVKSKLSPGEEREAVDIPVSVPSVNISPVNTPHVASIADTTATPSGKGTACFPCSNNHLHVCKGLLDEAVRFAQTDGITAEVIERVDGCLGEISAAERIDLSPEAISKLSGEDQNVARDARKELRDIRHGLEHISDPNNLESIAAQVAALQRKVSLQWFMSKLSPEQRERLIQLRAAKQ